MDVGRYKKDRNRSSFPPADRYKYRKIEKKISSVATRKKVIIDRREEIGEEYRTHRDYLDKVEEFFNENSLDDFLKRQEALKEKQGELQDLLRNLDSLEKESKFLKNKISLLSTVPCGDKYPHCRFLQDATTSKGWCQPQKVDWSQ